MGPPDLDHFGALLRKRTLLRECVGLTLEPNFVMFLDHERKQRDTSVGVALPQKGP